ncbi:MAG: hypothetical protein CR991_10250 [Proteobacteria bacterium]|nr:MAG: hypothetical protein CR991_10250 [Pseudomonadota bacterium]
MPNITITVNTDNNTTVQAKSSALTAHIEQIFGENPIRIQRDNADKFWFCGKDICQILGYSNSRKAISDHCRKDGVTNRNTIDNLGRTQPTTFINEGNLYRLIVKSQKPEAGKFETWIFEEVLPSIRKTGYYVMPDQPEEPETLSHQQYQAIRTMINRVSYFFRNQQAVEYALNNYLRFEFNADRVKYLQASDYDKAMAFLSQAEASGTQVLELYFEFEKWLIKEYLCKGVPLTANLKRKEAARLRKQLPTAMNWKTIALNLAE